MAARRWYLLVPLVLASVGVAYLAYTQMPAVYTATVVHQINSTASGSSGGDSGASAGSGSGDSGDTGDTGDAAGDGSQSSFGTSSALAGQLAQAVQPPATRGRQAPPYTVTARPDAPMITVRADGESPAKALDTVNAVSDRMITELATLQNDQRVPSDAQLKLDTPVPASVAPPVRTTGIKVFAATLLFGLMLSVLLAAAVERSARQRRALLEGDDDLGEDSGDELDDFDGAEDFEPADDANDVGDGPPRSGEAAEAGTAGADAGRGDSAAAGPRRGDAPPGDENPTEVVVLPGLRRTEPAEGATEEDAPTEVAAMAPVRDQPARDQPERRRSTPPGPPLVPAGAPSRSGALVRSLAAPPPSDGRSVGGGALGQLRAVPPGGPASRAGAAAVLGQGAPGGGPAGPPPRLSPSAASASDRGLRAQPGGPPLAGPPPAGPPRGRPDRSGPSAGLEPPRRDQPPRPVDPLGGPSSSTGGLGYHPPLANPFGGPDSSTFDSSSLWAPSTDTGGTSGWLPATPLPAGAPFPGSGPDERDDQPLQDWLAEPERAEMSVASLGGDPLGIGADDMPIGNLFDRELTADRDGDAGWADAPLGAGLSEESPAERSEPSGGSGPGYPGDESGYTDQEFGSGAGGYLDDAEADAEPASDFLGTERDADYSDGGPGYAGTRAEHDEPAEYADDEAAEYADDEAAEYGRDDTGGRDDTDDRDDTGRGRDAGRGRNDATAETEDDDGFGWPEFDDPDTDDATADAGPPADDEPPTNGSPPGSRPTGDQRGGRRQPREAAAGY
jgi:hypothetical protein